MKERPILMRTHEVQALLDGRKTQSRTVVKPQPVFVDPVGVAYAHIHSNTGDAPSVIIEAPCKPGDILWVRETFRELCDFDSDCAETVEYLADGGHELLYEHDGDGFQVFNKDGTERFIAWKPPLHMPKSAARIWLEVESVRVERLQDISEEDAEAEGVEKPEYLDGHSNGRRIMFKELWQSIHGPESWDANPWVWVITYRILSTNGKP